MNTRRDQILLFAAEYAATHGGNSPSLGEIASRFGISFQAVYKHTLKLAAEGRIVRRDGKLCLVGAQFSPPLITPG